MIENERDHGSDFAMMQEKMAREFGVTKQRIGQIEQEAIRKLWRMGVWLRRAGMIEEVIAELRCRR